MKYFLGLIYLVLVFIITVFGIGPWLAVSYEDLVIASLFTFPLLIALWLVLIFILDLVKPKTKVRARLTLPNPASQAVGAEKGFDEKRRLFLKALGTLGLGGLVYLLFTKKAQALQFGGTGVPDPIGVEPLGGSQTTGSVTLTSADTWYQVPSSNQSNRVFLALQNRSGYDMYWALDNTVSASTGGLLFPDGATLQLDAGNAVNVYVRCGTAAQVCWYAESQSQ
jgi:hypothetical protein